MKNDPFFINEIEAFMKKAQEETRDLNDEDLPSVERHQDIPLYYLKPKRSKGNTGFYMNLDENIFASLKSSGLLSRDAENSNGPFRAEDIKVISEIFKDAWDKEKIPAFDIEDAAQKQIGKEIISEPMNTWKEFSTVDSFDIVRMNPTASLLGAGSKAEDSVGTMSLRGDLFVDQEQFGKKTIDYLLSKNPYQEKIELMNIIHKYENNSPGLNEEKEEAVKEHFSKWRARYNEAVERAVNDFYPEDLIPDDGPVDEREIAIGEDIELVPSPDNYWENDESTSDYEQHTYQEPQANKNDEDEDSEGWYAPTGGEIMPEVINRRSLLIYELSKLADSLDSEGKHIAADLVDSAIHKIAQETYVDEAGVTWTYLGSPSFNANLDKWESSEGKTLQVIKGKKPTSVMPSAKEPLIKQQTPEVVPVETPAKLPEKQLGFWDLIDALTPKTNQADDVKKPTAQTIRPPN